MPAPEKRTFEFVEGISSKFWEVWIQGEELTTRWGRLGTDGQSKSKTFASAAKADSERDKLIAEKMGKGYRETTIAATGESAAPAVPEPTKPAESDPLAEAASPLPKNDDRQSEQRLESAMKTVAESFGTDRPAVRTLMQEMDRAADRALKAAEAVIASPAAPAPRPPTPKEIEELVWKFARQYKENGFNQSASPDSVPAGKELMNLKPAGQIEALIACLRLRREVERETRYDTLRELGERLLRRNLPYTDSDCEFLAGETLKSASDRYSHGIDKFLVGAIEKHASNRPLTGFARNLLRQARDGVGQSYFIGNQLKMKSRLDALTGEDRTRIPIEPGEVWSDTAIDEIDQMAEPQRQNWVQLIQHSLDSKGAQATAAWRKKAETLLKAVTDDDFARRIANWFSFLDKPRTGPLPGYQPNDPHAIAEANQDILRGLIWCCGMSSNESMPKTIALATVSAYRKIPQVGCRAVRVGNAGVSSLGSMHSLDAVAQLSFLKIKVKFGTAQRMIEKQLNEAAGRMNIPRDDLEEMSVPAYGLEDVGVRRETLGDFTAELVVDTSGAEIRWLKSDGKPQKTVPANVKGTEEYKELTAAVKDIDKMLPAQRDRLDALCLLQKTWPLSVWRERYLDHPLVGVLARRMIWSFCDGTQQTSAIFFNGSLVDHHGQKLEHSDRATVEVWHPISRPVEEVAAWRGWHEGA